MTVRRLGSDLDAIFSLLMMRRSVLFCVAPLVFSSLNRLPQNFKWHMRRSRLDWNNFIQFLQSNVHVLIPKFLRRHSHAALQGENWAGLLIAFTHSADSSGRTIWELYKPSRWCFTLDLHAWIARSDHLGNKY